MKSNVLLTIFTWLSGVASILGFIAGIVPIATLYFSTPSEDIANLKAPFISMAISIGLLTFTLMLLNIYYGLRIHNLSHLSLEQYQNKIGYEKAVRLIDANSKLMHNTLHHLRYMIYAISEENFKFLSPNSKNPSKIRVSELLGSLNTYLITLADNIKIFFDKATEDDCSVCIKLINNRGNEVQAKTMIRDSNSYRERKENDLSESRNPRVYAASDNTAFNIICSENFKETYFACNDLKALHDEGRYTNSNLHWQSSYNATLVVPISILPKKENKHERHIAGFLCIDNMKGELKQKYLLDIVAGIADILFILFLEYDAFIKNGKNLGVKHEQIRRYEHWN